MLARSVRLDGTDADARRAQILESFHATFSQYESLFRLLRDNASWTEKPIALRHPLIFYLGHTATFFVNKLVLAGLMSERIDPAMESMFAVGVDEMSWDDLDDTRYRWPDPGSVFAYRRKVRAAVEQVIATAPLTLPIGWDDPLWPVLMGIEHERIHLETSSVLIRQQRLELTCPHPDWAPVDDDPQHEPPPQTCVPVCAGTVVLGRSFDDPVYGWDNEYGHHEAEVPAFEAARHLTSNRAFLAFVTDGGYQQDEWWDDEGLAWRRFAGAAHPTFWIPDGAQWRLRLLAETVPMRWAWPVEVNCHEARAWCRWQSARLGRKVRLPSEDEWHRMLDVSGCGAAAAAGTLPANLYLDHGASPCAVDRFAHGPFYDLVGNVWQWCETPTYPFDGFRVHPLYDDFTAPTFDNRHNIIKGGSFISTGNEARPPSRYAFRRHFFQHAGFRYVISDAPAPEPSAIYESDALLSQYLEFHYGERYFDVPNFSQTLAQIAIDAFRRHCDRAPEHALDLGCATGRASFELARHFTRVTGVDFSARFIQAGAALAHDGVVRYTLPTEGELVDYCERRLDALGLADTADRVSFWQGDACNLKGTLTGYDLVLAANLVDRLYSPRRFLAAIGGRMSAGGLLVIATPGTWLTEYTPRDEWLGGYKRDGESFTTLDGLRDALLPQFELLEAPRDVPFVIRETARKFQHTCAQLTLWRKR